MKYQTIELTAEQLDWETNNTRLQESEEAMISYGDQLAVKYDNDNTLIISSMTSLKMPSSNITGDSNFGTILESKVCVSAANTSIDQSSKFEASMKNDNQERQFGPLSAKCWTHLHLQRDGTFHSAEPRQQFLLQPNEVCDM